MPRGSTGAPTRALNGGSEHGVLFTDLLQQTRRQDQEGTGSRWQLNQPTPPLERRRVVVPDRAQSCRAEGILRQQLKRLENESSTCQVVRTS